jgi:hypothetical protein
MSGFASHFDGAMFAKNFSFPFNEQGDPGGDLPENNSLFFALVALAGKNSGAMMIDDLHRPYKAAWQGDPN